MGDARGRLAGCLTIRDRVIKLIDKYGLDYFKDVTREYIEDSRRYAVSRVKTQAVPGRVRKSIFKDLAMKGKRVILPQQDIDCLFNLPMEVEDRLGREADALPARRQRLGSLRPEHDPVGPDLGRAERLLPRGRLRHVQLGRGGGLEARDAAGGVLGQPVSGTTTSPPRASAGRRRWCG